MPTLDTYVTGDILGYGWYTPTLSNVSNVAASTAYQCQWFRIGRIVHVSGKVDIDSTSTGSTQLGISLPIASNLGAQEDLAGTAVSTVASAENPGAVRGDSTNDRAEIFFVAISNANNSWYFTFTYEVI